jgi:16S rRNA (guanine(966)-N(2))-methyltransferase RsmD
MRVIAGSARGIRLAAPAGRQTRPTADRVKEALFSIILSRHELAGARILDICAGTGSLGIEALSRGAAFCCFIEQERPVMTLLQKNLVTAGFGTISECLTLEAITGLALLSRQSKQFNIVFFDPPYVSGLYAVVPDTLSTLSLLSAGGVLVVECSAKSPLEEHYGALVRADRRIYGDTALEFYIRESP